MNDEDRLGLKSVSNLAAGLDDPVDPTAATTGTSVLSLSVPPLPGELS